MGQEFYTTGFEIRVSEEMAAEADFIRQVYDQALRDMLKVIPPGRPVKHPRIRRVVRWFTNLRFLRITYTWKISDYE